MVSLPRKTCAGVRNKNKIHHGHNKKKEDSEGDKRETGKVKEAFSV